MILPSSFPSSFSNNNQSVMSGAASISVPTLPVSGPLPSPSSGRAGSALAGGFNELRISSGSRKARVLYDYDAAGSSELSLLADEVRPERTGGRALGPIVTPWGSPVVVR